MFVVFFFNSLWPSDAIWQQGSWSTLAQVMACCLMAPSHYLNQCWFIIIGVLWHSPESGFTRGAHEFICDVCWKIIFWKFQPHLPGANELNACSVNAKLHYIPRIMVMRFVAFCFGIGPYSTHILQGYFTGTWAIIWLSQCQWSNPVWQMVIILTNDAGMSLSFDELTQF